MSIDLPMHFKASGRVFGFAKKLRQELTPTESILWEAIRNRKVHGLKFRREHPIGQFIADFYCHDHQLVLEIDGHVHEQLEQAEYDRSRDFVMAEMGIRTLRFTNDEIDNQLAEVLAKIATVAGKTQIKGNGKIASFGNKQHNHFRKFPLSAGEGVGGEVVRKQISPAGMVCISQQERGQGVRSILLKIYLNRE